MIFNSSPAHNKGRNNTKIDRVVIHWFGKGNLEAANRHFTRLGATTSAHYGIEDNKIIQWVREDDTAWHAGNLAMNRRSIGIELSAEPNRPASEATIQNSAKLIANLHKWHGIPLDRKHIIGHSEVKATQCPGTIPIDRIIELARSMSEIPTDSGGNMQDREYRNMYYRALDAIFALQSALNLPSIDGWADHKEKLQQATNQFKDRMLQRMLDIENLNKNLVDRNNEITTLSNKVKELEGKLENLVPAPPTNTGGALSYLTIALHKALKGQW